MVVDAVDAAVIVGDGCAADGGDEAGDDVVVSVG